MKKISVIGLGNWGSNILRALVGLKGVRVHRVCDTDKSALDKALATYPELVGTDDPHEAVSGADAVVVATPSPTHYQIGLMALGAGAHAFVEKPMAMTLGQAEEMVHLARSKGLVLMPGHILLFHPGIQKLKSLVSRGDLGEIRYTHSQRTNLGVVRSNENVVWSLAPHDIYISNHIMEAQPVSARVFGRDFLQKGIEDVAFLTLEYPDRRFSHIHVSWLDPKKTRRLTVVGSAKMAVFDDMEEEEKLRIYDKGVDEPGQVPPGTFHIRYGDIYSPKIPKAEPLKAELRHFVACISGQESPVATGEDGLAVVKVLEQLTGL